jgi:galactose-1-phosphate uridylyltransferase
LAFTFYSDYGFVSIIKNYGHLVGGSLAHGHQQIILSSVIPKRCYNNWLFRKERGESFSAYLMTRNPPEFTIRDYGKAVLIIPYFMKRPFDMLLLVKDSRKSHLHELTAEEIKAVAEGWADAIRVILRLMPQIGREVAYNVLANNGPGAGIYFEFLPFTQEMGGFEQLGLFLCQANPLSAAVKIRTILEV